MSIHVFWQAHATFLCKHSSSPTSNAVNLHLHIISLLEHLMSCMILYNFYNWQAPSVTKLRTSEAQLAREAQQRAVQANQEVSKVQALELELKALREQVEKAKPDESKLRQVHPGIKIVLSPSLLLLSYHAYHPIMHSLSHNPNVLILW